MSWVLAEPFKGIQRIVPHLLLHGLGYVLRVSVVLEGEPSALCKVLNTLEWVFIQDVSVLCRAVPD